MKGLRFDTFCMSAEQSNELSEKLRRMLGVEEKFDKLNEELENYRTEMAVTETQKLVLSNCDSYVLYTHTRPLFGI